MSTTTVREAPYRGQPKRDDEKSGEELIANAFLGGNEGMPWGMNFDCVAEKVEEHIRTIGFAAEAGMYDDGDEEYRTLSSEMIRIASMVNVLAKLHGREVESLRSAAADVYDGREAAE